MAFKKDVDDLRHSPALKVTELLCQDGMQNVSYYDPFIPTIKVCDKIMHSEKKLNKDLIKNFDIIVVTTDHSDFDYKMIAENAKVIIDTRNAFKGFKNRENIVLLGDGK
jgi:UDP-N-acetyl-D-glucosamine dehydrogenase